MTPMVDLAFLLVTFFMLTTKFAPEESVVVDTPSSVSELKLPENNVITLTVDKNKRVFFGVDAKQTKIQALQRVGYLLAAGGVRALLIRQLDYAGNPPAWPLDR